MEEDQIPKHWRLLRYRCQQVSSEACIAIHKMKHGRRNWGFHWNTGGSSSNPCADTYMGREAFSEVENRNVRDFLLANKDQIKFYNNLHSYRKLQHCLSVKYNPDYLLNSQLILLPWGWGYDLPDNIDDLTRVIL